LYLNTNDWLYKFEDANISSVNLFIIFSEKRFYDQFVFNGFFKFRWFVYLLLIKYLLINQYIRFYKLKYSKNLC
jgi:hypothetical protein